MLIVRQQRAREYSLIMLNNRWTATIPKISIKIVLGPSLQLFIYYSKDSKVEP